MKDKESNSNFEDLKSQIKSELELKIYKFAEESGSRKVQKKSFFNSAAFPIVLSALFGLLGTGFGAWLQGESNLNLEKQKFEANLILKMIETNGDQQQAASNLEFLIKAGLIENKNLETRLSDLIEKKEVPSIGVVSGQLKESNPGFDFTKSLQEQLSKLGYYKGAIDSKESEELRKAVISFQKDNGLPADGIVSFSTRAAVAKEYWEKFGE